ncbi:2,5-diamino-6-(ribosylamino)-4(3H)-pyrimidinone 5'-phosphate reductase [Coemansia sp. RSA 2424]|nr:2,5-diamino-6-(ribosylamino)-4(3H)-pyrimidinone 5'-phosphate reductase [Coemansia sp. RSA 2424]
MRDCEDCDYDHARTFVSQHVVPSSPKDGLRVTLTYAQSLDGMISRRNQALALSSPASLLMTHQLRATHDAILVGIGTVLCDDPQLSVRHVPPTSMHQNPQPVVLDTMLRIPLDARLLVGPRDDTRLKMPWIVVGPRADPEKRRAVEELGATVIVVNAVDGSGRIKLESVVGALETRGAKRLMVEGGAKVIAAFLGDAPELVHRLVVTIAPVFVGAGEGVPAVGGCHFPVVKPLAYEQFGCDVVMVASISSSQQ